MKKIAVFPGSFDPFTKGHEGVVHSALPLFDEVIIAIGTNSNKKSLFELETREQHIQSLFSGEKKIKIISFQGLTIDFCKQHDSSFIIRGLRNVVDFEYEKSIAQMNKDVSGIETIFFITDIKYSAINSSIVREIFLNQGNIDAFVTNAGLLV